MKFTETDGFKKCPCCGEIWKSRDDFIRDTSLYFNGYMADFLVLEKGLFYFTHLVEGCRSTLVAPAGQFLDLYSGERYTPNNVGKDDCPGYCLENGPLQRCDAVCEYAFVREVIQVILSFKNQPPEAFDPEMVSLPWRDKGLS